MNRFQMVSATHLLDSSGGIGAEVLFSDAMRRLCDQTLYLQEKKEDEEVGSWDSAIAIPLQYVHMAKSSHRTAEFPIKASVLWGFAS